MKPERDMPKILMVDFSLRYGGASSRALTLLQNLPNEKVALAGLKRSAISKKADDCGITVFEVGSHKLDPAILKNLICIVREQKFQLIDTQNVQSKFWGSMAAGMTKIPLVSTLNSWYLDEHKGNPLKGQLYTRLELATNRPLKRYITVSKMDRASLVSAGINEHKIDTIYNAVNINPENIPGDADWLRKQYKLPEDAIVCTAVGRLVKVKGHQELIQAISLIARKNPRVHCLIVGDGELHEILIQLITRLGLQNRVHLLGFQERELVLSIVKSSDYFVMPSRHEGTPLAILEAAALGRPIVASYCGGIPELVRDEEHALLVPVNNPVQLANALIRLINNPKLADTIRQNAQMQIRNNFNIETQVQATLETYRRALTQL